MGISLISKEALENKWIQGDDEKFVDQNLGQTLTELKNFDAKRKFKAAIRS